MEKVFTIVAAAGRGKRLGARTSKMYVEIQGLPLIIHTLQSLDGCPSCQEVALVVNEGVMEMVGALLQKHAGLFSTLHCSLVEGGKTRQESVYNALQKIPAGYDYIAIHDGARPFITSEVFEGVLQAAREKVAAIAAVAVHDTVKLVRNGLIESTPDRRHVFFAQTPQIFSTEIFVRAANMARETGFHGTDDAALVEKLGYRITVAEGDPDNFKITTPIDFAWAELKLGGCACELSRRSGI
jgi:2-C-methyl-D-erythritol 4-phosphate cytidylyltransferase